MNNFDFKAAINIAMIIIMIINNIINNSNNNEWMKRKLWKRFKLVRGFDNNYINDKLESVKNKYWDS